jgi:maltoporin
MSNPSLILICTLAASVCAWGPGFRGAGGGNDYATEQEGLTYGVQMEAWW